MGIEIERKFLVIGDKWRGLGNGTLYRQGYLGGENGRTARVRIAGDQAFLTIKGPTNGISRSEFEYPIPLADANDMLVNLCQQPIIEKTRYIIPYQGQIWEVDEFSGENNGLIVAEIELATENQTIICPDWIGEEVSADRRYGNASLVHYPFSRWRSEP